MGSIGSPKQEIEVEANQQASLTRHSAPAGSAQVGDDQRQARSSSLEGMIWLKRTNRWVVRHAVLEPGRRPDPGDAAICQKLGGANESGGRLRYGGTRREALSELELGGVRDVRLANYDISASGPANGCWTIPLRSQQPAGGHSLEVSPAKVADGLRDVLLTASSAANYRLRFESKQICMRWLRVMGCKPTPEEQAELQAAVERASAAVARGSVTLLPEELMQDGQPTPMMARRPL